MDAATVDNPFSGTNTGEWLGGILAGAVGVYAAYKKWARSEHAEDRKEGAEDRVDGAYDEVITIMRQQIRDSTLDRADMRKQLERCEAQHVQCREEHASDRLQIDGMRLRIEELERERDR